MATVTAGVTLTLSVDEASALRDILGRVGGVPTETRRGLTTAVYDALNAAGVPRGPRDAEGWIYFQAA